MADCTGIGSAFRAHGTCAVKIRKVTLGEGLLRYGIALNAVADAQNCFREYSSGAPTLKIAFRIVDRKLYINSKDSKERKLQKETVFNT